MVCQFYTKNDYTLHMKERHSKSQIAYYSKRKMDELYVDGRYEVIGEIGNFVKKHSSQDVITDGKGNNIPIFPRGSLSKPFEWIAGYSAVGENTYVAVVKCVIPLLIWKYGVKKKHV